MKQTRQHRESTRRVPVGLMAGAIVAVGALSASTLAATTAGAATGVTVSTATNAKVGTVLVSGKTVYTLKASKTPCTAACLTVWPELVLPKGVTKATAGTGVNASKLGTVKRSGGVLQVTYSGKPLYYFSGDSAAGQVNGNVTDTWGKWAAVVTAKPTGGSSSGGTTSTTSGGSSAGSGGASF
jgi:predicted lipoprotein with Yx(FWY)xxD motif